MVFVWGTSYKLSLYKVERATTSAPAKVCTRGSDAARSAVDQAADGPQVGQTALLVAALFDFDETAETYPLDRRREEAVHDLSPLRRAPILYLRPPPYEGHLLD
jgi:hypothetical protein